MLHFDRSQWCTGADALHGIPEDDIERRYYQSFENLKSILSICDIVVLYDNTKSFCPVATFYNGNCKGHTKEIPEWAKQFISQEEKPDSLQKTTLFSD